MIKPRMVGLSRYSAIASLAASVVASVILAPFSFGAGSKNFGLNNTVGQNSISFISEAPMEKIVGTADGVSGSFKLDLANLEGTVGKIVVEVRSMKTAIARRDENMYNAQWLDAAKFPTITFDISSLKDVKVTKQDGKTLVSATAVGTFSCHGVTKPLTATISINYLNENVETKKRAPGDLVMINATFRVALKDFNVTGKQGLIGSSVGETIDIAANLYANSAGQ